MSKKFSIVATIDFNKLDNEIGEYVKRNGNFDPYIFMSEDTAEAIKNEYEVEYGLDVDRAIWLVKEYGKKGYLIETLFFKDTTRDYIENTQNRIDVLERKLK